MTEVVVHDMQMLDSRGDSPAPGGMQGGMQGGQGGMQGGQGGMQGSDTGQGGQTPDLPPAMEGDDDLPF